jgi:hypothetical protein
MEWKIKRLKPPTRAVSILKWPHDLDDWGGTPYE